MTPKAMSEAFIELVDACNFLHECDSLFYTGFNDRDGWYVCRECNASARIFDRIEHDDGCPIGDFEKALEKVK